MLSILEQAQHWKTNQQNKQTNNETRKAYFIFFRSFLKDIKYIFYNLKKFFSSYSRTDELLTA